MRDLDGFICRSRPTFLKRLLSASLLLVVVPFTFSSTVLCICAQDPLCNHFIDPPRYRLELAVTMKLAHVLSRTQSNDSMVSRRHVPWTASPLDKRAMSSSGREGSPLETKPNMNERVVQFEQGSGRPHSDEPPVFKPHRESSTVELFYDLFFVANLTVFTKNHEINSGHGGYCMSLGSVLC